MSGSVAGSATVPSVGSAESGVSTSTTTPMRSTICLASESSARSSAARRWIGWTCACLRSAASEIEAWMASRDFWVNLSSCISASRS